MNPDREQVLIDFYNKFDICTETDLLGGYFMHDPLCVFESPTFPIFSQLEDWVFNNLGRLEKLLS